jgi:similar to stage IV sporulation protein
LAFILSSLFVWDVRIDGNCETPDALIENELSEAGLSVGSPWFLLHLDKVESELLEKSESVGWISVNRRGHVAYVTVKEKNEPPQAQGSEAVYSNVVATKDCVIDSIVVKKGMPMVKNGDSVKAGDILISGIIPSELGGGFVRAEGEVFGRTTETVGVFVAREETGTLYGEEVLQDKKINFFNFSINIFKNYRNSCNECVIIEETEESLILGKYRLPIQTVSTYSREKLRQSRIYTDSELVSIGKYRLECAKALRLYDAEIMRTVTDASLTEEGYRVESKVTVLRDVAREERIFAEVTKT